MDSRYTHYLHPLLDLDTSWHESAACRDTDNPDAWFPTGQPGPGGDDKYLAQTAEAKAVCARCSVSDKCLQQAFEINDKHSVRGGLDPWQRQAINRRERRRVRR